MRTLYLRIKKRVKMTRENWKNDCGFSVKLACFRLVDEIGGRMGAKRLARWAHNEKEKWIINFLQNGLKDNIEKYVDCVTKGTKVENAPIWVCWWEGENNAPQLVQQCIKSIRKNAKGHPVHIISKYNYSNYLEIPEFIMKKLKIKKIGLAHFSDYIRVSLIERYGGLWLDATIFCTKTIPDEYFELPYFTCKSNIKKGFYLSDFQWTTFCLGGWKGNLFYTFIKEAMEYYWKINDKAIDYLFFDDLIYIAKENIPFIKQLLNEVPINNIHRDDLQAAMNEVMPGKDFWNIIQSDTVLYKLSWREQYKKETLDGEESVFGYFLKLNIL